MIDIQIQDIQVKQECIIDHSQIFQASNGIYYQLSEVDLSFSDALAGSCSSETSCGGVNKPTINLKHV